VSEEGMVNVVAADTAKLNVLAKNDLKERSLASPAAFNNTLLLRTQDHLWKIVASSK